MTAYSLFDIDSSLGGFFLHHNWRFKMLSGRGWWRYENHVKSPLDVTNFDPRRPNVRLFTCMSMINRRMLIKLNSYNRQARRLWLVWKTPVFFEPPWRAYDDYKTSRLMRSPIAHMILLLSSFQTLLITCGRLHVYWQGPWRPVQDNREDLRNWLHVSSSCPFLFSLGSKLTK